MTETSDDAFLAELQALRPAAINPEELRATLASTEHARDEAQAEAERAERDYAGGLLHATDAELLALSETARKARLRADRLGAMIAHYKPVLEHAIELADTERRQAEAKAAIDAANEQADALVARWHPNWTHHALALRSMLLELSATTEAAQAALKLRIAAPERDALPEVTFPGLQLFADWTASFHVGVQIPASDGACGPHAAWWPDRPPARHLPMRRNALPAEPAEPPAQPGQLVTSTSPARVSVLDGGDA